MDWKIGAVGFGWSMFEAGTTEFQYIVRNAKEYTRLHQTGIPVCVILGVQFQDHNIQKEISWSGRMSWKRGRGQAGVKGVKNDHRAKFGQLGPNNP